MNKRYLFALLLVSGGAHAEWVLYGDNGKAAFYYDDKSIIASGNQVIVWEMLNYGFALNGVQSNRSRKEYDCAGEKFRTLEGEFYSQPDLKGERLSGNPEADNWRPVVAGTRNEELMRLVCGMRS